MATKKKAVKKALAPAVKKKQVHYTEQYLISPAHPVTVHVIGCGGTGSQVINSLARMHSALKALGHPGLYITAIDDDKVSEANMGRQLFSQSDVGEYKCITLIGRVNRFFGLDWKALPIRYSKDVKPANITISCVDSGKSRKEVMDAIAHYIDEQKHTTTHAGNYSARRVYLQPYEKPYYWMDYGNMKDRGQVVLGTVVPIEQPKGSAMQGIPELKSIVDLHPDILKDLKSDDQGPSCSLAEALGKQDLFINTNLANMGLGILWKMFRELHIKYNGLYLNLETMSVNPIKIQA
jgi:PRTRC genetic system ThiF family protein